MAANILQSLFLVSSFLLFLFASQCSSFSISTLTPEAEAEAKVAAMQYWNLRVPYNKPLPPILLSKLQNTSNANHPVECTMSSAADNTARLGSKNRRLLQLLVWRDHNDAIGATRAVENAATLGLSKRRLLQLLVWRNHKDAIGATRAAENAATLGLSKRRLLQLLVWRDHQQEPQSALSESSIKMVTQPKDQNNDPQELDQWRPLFFRERDLKEGRVTHLYDFNVEAPPLLPFLPGSTAHKIPFSAAAIKEIFHLSEDSEMRKDVERAVSECHHAPAPGETRRCVVTAEDMIDYVILAVGSNNIDANNTANSDGFGRDVLVGEIKMVNDPAAGKLMRIVTCHQVKFPFLLHHCHSLKLNRVYEVQLLDVETKKEINRVLATCHLDTSDWDTEQRALKVLGGQPGEIEVCHWLAPFDIIWTATGN